MQATIDDARRIEPRRNLPGGRAVVGALLITLAALGVFVAYLGAQPGRGGPVLIAATDIHLGQVLTSADVRVVRGDLPRAARAARFTEPRAVVGHAALGPIRKGEVVQAGALSTDAVPDDGATNEVALTLPRPQVAVGRLREGDRVDALVTNDAGTSIVAQGVRVVQLSTGDGSLTDERTVTLVVAVPDAAATLALVHAERTGEVTIVRSTLSRPSTPTPTLSPAPPGDHP